MCGERARARDARPEGRDPQPVPAGTRSEASMALPARLLARQGSPVAQRCARNLVTPVTAKAMEEPSPSGDGMFTCANTVCGRRRVLARSANARIAASRPGPDTGRTRAPGQKGGRRRGAGPRRGGDETKAGPGSLPNPPSVHPSPARPGSQERAGGRSGQSLQPVSEAIGEASQRISTSSRPSFSKARQSATSLWQSNGPCSRPVASSMTVQVGSQTGMPR